MSADSLPFQFLYRWKQMPYWMLLCLVFYTFHIVFLIFTIFKDTK